MFAPPLYLSRVTGWCYIVINAPPSVFVIDYFYQSFGLQKTIYKIIFHLQMNLDKKSNIYFLTTIRFFASFARFV